MDTLVFLDLVKCDSGLDDWLRSKMCDCQTREIPYERSIMLIYYNFSGKVNMNINAVEQGTRDPLLIFGNDGGHTCTGLLGILKITTRTGIHRRDQLKICGEG